MLIKSEPVSQMALQWMKVLTKTGLVDGETLEGTSKATPDKEVSDNGEMLRMQLPASATRAKTPSTFPGESLGKKHGSYKRDIQNKEWQAQTLQYLSQGARRVQVNLRPQGHAGLGWQRATVWHGEGFGPTVNMLRSRWWPQTRRLWDTGRQLERGSHVQVSLDKTLAPTASQVQSQARRGVNEPEGKALVLVKLTTQRGKEK